MANAVFKAQAYLPANGIESNSNIHSLEYMNGDLIVVVMSSLDWNGHASGIRLTFPGLLGGFRLLDELELMRYMTSAEFPGGCHLLEVTEGGWKEEEDALQGLEKERREWLVVAGNACVSVFCSDAPEVVYLCWKQQFNWDCQNSPVSQ